MTAKTCAASLLAVTLLLSLSCRENDLVRVPDDSDPPGATPLPETPATPAPPPEVPPEIPPAPRPESCQTGAVMGRLCLPGTADSLEGARVSLRATDCLGNEKIVETTARSGGRFSLVDVPEGLHAVRVDDARWQGTLAAVEVAGGEIATADNQSNGEPICLGQTQPRIAVVTGNYDDITDLLEQLGLKYDLYDGERYFSPLPTGESLVEDPAKLAQYDAIFFACGSLRFLDLAKTNGWYNPEHRVFKNLKTFLSHGGNLYASDFAWPLAEVLAPDELDFAGDDKSLSASQVGADGTVLSDIRNASLAAFMGAKRLPIRFDLPNWAVLEAAGPNTEVFVSGDVTRLSPRGTLKNAPLIVSTRPTGTGGRVLFTTFHHHSQSSDAMQDVLRFLIFQL